MVKPIFWPSGTVLTRQAANALLTRLASWILPGWTNGVHFTFSIPHHRSCPPTLRRHRRILLSPPTLHNAENTKTRDISAQNSSPKAKSLLFWSPADRAPDSASMAQKATFLSAPSKTKPSSRYSLKCFWPAPPNTTPPARGT